jgi:hypothetical protein
MQVDAMFMEGLQTIITNQFLDRNLQLWWIDFVALTLVHGYVKW